MADIELLESPKNIYYERYDFPMIDFGNLGDMYVDWNSQGENDLNSLIEDGIKIPKEDKELLSLELEDLKNKYGFNQAEFDFVNRGDGTVSLVWIKPEMCSYGAFIWGNKEDHAKDSMALDSHNRLYMGELRGSEEALFFVECLAHYMKYFGVEFPYIKAQFIGATYTKPNEYTHENRIFSFSFTLPFVPDFAKESQYQKKLSQSKYLTSHNFAMDNESIYVENKKVGTLISKEGGLYWEIDGITDPAEAIVLFQILGYPLKSRYAY